MRRCLAAATAALLLLAAACTDSEPDDEPAPPSEDEEEDAEDRPLPGLRVGVVLPPRDTGSADEVEAGGLGIDELTAAFEDDVAELRTVVPDSAAFVPDVAGLLVAEGYDLVCVLGRDAGDVVEALAQRHAATSFCGAPAEPVAEPLDNLLLVDVALAELGHVLGAAMGQLGGDDPVALLASGDRAAGQAFRSGVRAGVGATPLREARGDLEELGAEIEAALDDEVMAIMVDAGPDAADLIAGIEGVALLAPSPLLTAQDEGALRWRVRWEVVVEAVLVHLLDPEVELPAVLGTAEGVFAVDHGPQAGSDLVATVEQVMGELERGERDPLEPVADDEDDEDDEDDDEEDEATPDEPDPDDGAEDDVPVASPS